MHTIEDIKIGSIYCYMHPEDGFYCEVIELNCNDQIGYTKLKIINSKRPEHNWLKSGVILTELNFIKHWNAGHYILQSPPEPIIQARSRLYYL